MIIMSADRRLLCSLIERDYEKYVEIMFTIYSHMTDRHRARFGDDLVVMGGFLYFVLYMEAVMQGMQFDTLDRETMRLFLENKTTDIDVIGSVNCELNPFEIANDLREVGNGVFEAINTLPLKHPINPMLCLIGNVGLTSSVVDDEVRTRMIIRVGDEDDHVFESTIRQFGKSKSDEIHLCLYALKFVTSKPFVGVNIMRSVADQLFPRERFWKTVNVKGTKEEIYEKVRASLMDPLMMIKYRQGYLRAFVVRHIYINAHEYLRSVMTPTNAGLSSTVFYLQSRIVNTLNRDVYSAALNLRKTIPNNNEPADPNRVMEFLNMSLGLWENMYREITG